MPQYRFRDRREAGRKLAEALSAYEGRNDLIVLALPRGGVPIAFEIAHALHAPLDVFVVRKLGVPWQPELAMGAIAVGGVEVLNGDVITGYSIPPHVIRAVAEREGEELRRRAERYRGDRPFPQLTGQTVILVDDGLATGATMRAAISAVRGQAPRAIIVAVPVASAGACQELRAAVTEMICLDSPEDFGAVGAWYDDFSETSDDEVRRLLSDSAVPVGRLQPNHSILST
jgi:putative phosphoribosyl transferase